MSRSPDEFESQFLPGEGEVFFRDKVPVGRYLIALATLGPVAAGTVLIATGTVAWPAAIAIAAGMGGVGLFGNLALLGTRTVVSEGGIQITVGVLKRFSARIDEVVSTEVVDASIARFPMGRGQVRRGLGGVAYGIDLGIRQGVRITLTSGRVITVGSTDAAGLRAAIERARQPVRARVDVSELESEVESGLESELEMAPEPPEAAAEADG